MVSIFNRWFGLIALTLTFFCSEIVANEARTQASKKTNDDNDSEDQVTTDKIEKSEEE